MTMQTQPNSGPDLSKAKQFMINPVNLTEGVEKGTLTSLEKAVEIRLGELRLPPAGTVFCELVAPSQGNYRCGLIQENGPLVVEVAEG